MYMLIYSVNFIFKILQSRIEIPPGLFLFVSQKNSRMVLPPALGHHDRVPLRVEN